jgi:transposase
MQIMTKHYPVEQRKRAVKMVLDHLDEYRSVYAACQAIGPKVGVGAESLQASYCSSSGADSALKN